MQQVMTNCAGGFTQLFSIKFVHPGWPKAGTAHLDLHGSCGSFIAPPIRGFGQMPEISRSADILSSFMRSQDLWAVSQFPTFILHEVESMHTY